MNRALAVALAMGMAVALPERGAAGTPDKASVPRPSPTFGCGKWDAFMLGVTNAALAECVRSDVSNATVRLVVANYSTRHDDCQAREMKVVADALGLKLEWIKVYAATNESLYSVYMRAAREGDLVIDYRSYWNDSSNEVQAAVRAISENPDKLFLMPYGEIGRCPPTSTSLQGKGRKAYGEGLANLVTSIPLSPFAKGHVMSPLRRTAGDASEITFIAPASFAESPGVTCPSASATALAAAYALVLSERRATARQLVCLLSRGARLPLQMADLAEFGQAGFERLKQDVMKLTAPDALGRQGLVVPGVVSLTGIREEFFRHVVSASNGKTER